MKNNPTPHEMDDQGYLLGAWNQFFIVHRSGNVLSKARLIGSQHELSQKLASMQEGEFPSEFLTFINKAESQGIKKLFVDNSELQSQLKPLVNINIQTGSGSIFRDLRSKILGKGHPPPQNLIQDFAQMKVTKSLRQPEKILFRLLRFYYRFEATKFYYTNLIRESVIILFPAIPRGIENMDDFINQVMEAVQSPNEFSQDPTEEIAPIIQLEIDALNSCLGFILEIRNQQDSLQNQMSAITKQIAPNLTQLIGPLLSSELITRAFSLKNLALMPAGKIQLLGATQARRYTNGPKYGVLYKSEFLSHVTIENRGRLARSLSAIIAIAAKADYYTQNLIVESLHTRLQKRIQKLGGYI